MTSAKASILAIDDDPSIAGLLERALKGAGYDPRVASDAEGALAALKARPVDLLILDLALPGLSGISLLEILRQDPRSAAIPVLILTSKRSEADKVKGLKTGADDYLTKPFSMNELLARVEALLRRMRASESAHRVLEQGGIRVDFDSVEAAVNGKKVELRPAEFGLLAHLLRHPGVVLTYQTLADALSDGAKIMTSDNIFSHAKNLRKKLGPAGKRIETVYGIGYKFKAD